MSLLINEAQNGAEVKKGGKPRRSSRKSRRARAFVLAYLVPFIALLSILAGGMVLGVGIGLSLAAESDEPVYTAPIVVPVMPTLYEEEVVEVPEEAPKEAVALYTREELEMLALVIYQEAGGDACSDETRQMVGEVVLNRVADDRFPDTIEEVLLQKRQYGRLYWTGLVWPDRAKLPQEAHAVERAYDCAAALLCGTVERLLPEDVIWQSENIQGSEIVVAQDGFYFCR